MSKELIPYVILSAHPDYKRPYVLPQFGMIEEDKLKDYLLEQLVYFVYDRIDIENLESVDDVYNLWENFYVDCYMDNNPWEAKAIIDGKWKNVEPSNEELFKALIKEKNKRYVCLDDEEDDEDDENDDENDEDDDENDENDENDELEIEINIK